MRDSVDQPIVALQPWQAKDNQGKGVQFHHQKRKVLGQVVSKGDREIYRLMDKPSCHRFAIKEAQWNGVI